MDDVVLAVLVRYPAFLGRGRLEPLDNRGGFSGARLWRLMAGTGPLCLRATAPGEPARHLAWRHRLMAVARSSGLSFVPGVLPTADGATWVEMAGRCWELMDWMPGRADYRVAPSRQRLRAAARALGLVHDAWRPGGPQRSVCPAVRRRLDLLGDGAVPEAEGPVALAPLLERMRTVLCLWLPRLAGLLGPWQQRPFAVQPCLRDVWHDHLLFEGDRLTGLVDYAAVDMDSVAADLARMLGSLIEDDDDGWQAALSAYREVRACTTEEEALARVLDRAGAVLGLVNWLRWLGPGQKGLDQPGPALARVEDLLRRVEGWPVSAHPR
jgi:homoserine kinase type II